MIFISVIDVWFSPAVIGGAQTLLTSNFGSVSVEIIISRHVPVCPDHILQEMLRPANIPALVVTTN